MGKIIQVCLDAHYEEFVQKMTGSGDYADVSDVTCEGLRLLEEQEEMFDKAEWTLSPKGCLLVALSDTGIDDSALLEEDESGGKFHSAYLILERRMKAAGYITDENGETKDNSDSEKPAEIFRRTVKGFYPGASEDQISAAWDLFVYHLEFHGHTKNAAPESGRDPGSPAG